MNRRLRPSAIAREFLGPDGRQPLALHTEMVNDALKPATRANSARSAGGCSSFNGRPPSPPIGADGVPDRTRRRRNPHPPRRTSAAFSQPTTAPPGGEAHRPDGRPEPTTARPTEPAQNDRTGPERPNRPERPNQPRPDPSRASTEGDHDEGPPRPTTAEPTEPTANEGPPGRPRRRPARPAAPPSPRAQPDHDGRSDRRGSDEPAAGSPHRTVRPARTRPARRGPRAVYPRMSPCTATLWTVRVPRPPHRRPTSSASWNAGR